MNNHNFEGFPESGGSGENIGGNGGGAGLGDRMDSHWITLDECGDEGAGIGDGAGAVGPRYDQDQRIEREES